MKGISAYALDTLMGSTRGDTLIVSTANNTGFTNVAISVDMSGATVQNMALISKAGYGHNYSRRFMLSEELVVDNADVTFEGGKASSETDWSVGY